MALNDTFQLVKDASIDLALLDNVTINKVLHAVADALRWRTDYILVANEKDLARMDPANPLYDRLLLSADRIESITKDMRTVASLRSPLGRTSKHKTLPES